MRSQSKLILQKDSVLTRRLEALLRALREEREALNKSQQPKKAAAKKKAAAPVKRPPKKRASAPLKSPEPSESEKSEGSSVSTSSSSDAFQEDKQLMEKVIRISRLMA